MLVLVCVFAISACGKDGEETSGNTDSTTNAPVNDSTVETIDSSVPSDSTTDTSTPSDDTSKDSTEPSDDTSKDSSQPSDGTTVGNGLIDDDLPEDSANDIF